MMDFCESSSFSASLLTLSSSFVSVVNVVVSSFMLPIRILSDLCEDAEDIRDQCKLRFQAYSDLTLGLSLVIAPLSYHT